MPDALCPWEAPILLAAASGRTVDLEPLLRNSDEVNASDTEYGRSCLAWAVANGHGDTVRLLLQHNADPDAPDAGGRTPLLHAIANRDEETVKLLLNAEARVDLADFQGRSPLIAAAQRGCSEALVRMLLQAGADPDARDWRYGGTALSWSARRGYEGIVRVLLEYNATVDVRDECQRTPMAWAARKGHADIVKSLLERHACPEAQDSDGQTPFEAAFEAGHDGVVQLLRGKSIQEINDGLAARSPAARLADLRELYKTVTPDFDLNDAQDGEILIWAIRNEREEDALLLVEQGADVNQQGERGMAALAWAASYGLVNVVEALLDAGAESDPVDEDGWTPLMLAAEKDHTEIVRVLLAKGVNVNRKNEEDMTALLCASGESVVTLLLDAGADPNDADLNGRTPISYAAERGDESSVLLLLERGAMIEEGQESSPLMEAISQHNMAFVRLLLEKGADPYSDEYSCCEYPPLRHAADHGQVEIVRLLLEKDAVSARIKEDHILRAIDSACEAGHDYMVELLMGQYPFGCSDDEGSIRELQRVANEVAEQYGYDLLTDLVTARVNELQLGRPGET